MRRLLGGTTLYRLDALIAARLVPVLYTVGFAAIGLWAIGHLAAAFAASFGQGLWGILEIAVYGLLLVVALRIACEFVWVFFKEHEETAAALDRARGRNTLMEEVRDAIRDLAEDVDTGDLTPATDAAPLTGEPDDTRAGPAGIDPPSKEAGRRKRSPPAKT